MFWSAQYQEGMFQPEQGLGNTWHVWCRTGALTVLERGEFVRLLAEDPEATFLVNFANGSAARITPEHPFWHVLAKIAETYTVEVFPLKFKAEYVPWTGDPASSLRSFDAIRIRAKQISLSAGEARQ